MVAAGFDSVPDPAAPAALAGRRAAHGSASTAPKRLLFGLLCLRFVEAASHCLVQFRNFRPAVAKIAAGQAAVFRSPTGGSGSVAIVERTGWFTRPQIRIRGAFGGTWWDVVFLDAQRGIHPLPRFIFT